MRSLIFLIVVAVFFTSCGKWVRGNGNIVTQQKQVSGFTKVDAGGAVVLRFKQDAVTSVHVETDENLMEYLDIHVDGKTLVIETKRGYSLKPTKDVVVYISAPDLEEVELSGASKLYGVGILSSDDFKLDASGASEVIMEVNTGTFESELSGASKLQLKGSVEKFSVDASGASAIRCLDLKTAEAEFDLSGASEAEITAEKELKIEASGASHVKYRGNANINQKSSGASSVEKIN